MVSWVFRVSSAFNVSGLGFSTWRLGGLRKWILARLSINPIGNPCKTSFKTHTDFKPQTLNPNHKTLNSNPLTP